MCTCACMCVCMCVCVSLCVRACVCAHVHACCGRQRRGPCTGGAARWAQLSEWGLAGVHSRPGSGSGCPCSPSTHGRRGLEGLRAPPLSGSSSRRHVLCVTFPGVMVSMGLRSRPPDLHGPRGQDHSGWPTRGPRHSPAALCSASLA